jgi:hypothetical protein
MLVGGTLNNNSQVTWFSQAFLAETLGVSHVLILRHVQRLIKFGYLVPLAQKVRGKLSAIHGVIFDPENPPETWERGAEIDNSTQQFVMAQSVKRQSVKQQVVMPSALVNAWRSLVLNYSIIGIENQHWQELSILGCTTDHLRSIYDGRPLIGYYMQALRVLLKR